MEQNEVYVNLKDIEDAKRDAQSDIHKGSKGEVTKKAKPKKSEFYYQLLNVINNFNLSGWEDFPQTFHILSDRSGVRRVVEELEDKTCVYVDDAKVVDSIIDYCYRYLKNKKDALLTHCEALACFKMWKSLTPPIDEEMILPVAEKSEDKLCWHRLPFDIPETREPTPTFDEMFSRISNAEALKAFIGSIFSNEADRQQYVWIYGDGGNGKGRLINFLHEVLGPAYSVQQPPGHGDRFWLSGLLGARLAVFPDCDDTSFVSTGLFKGVTGGDAQRIEEKGKPIYTAKLNCKILILANDPPKMTSQESDARRTIYCTVDRLNQTAIPQRIYDAMLLAEGPSFLAECQEIYASLCPHHGPIPIDRDSLTDIIEKTEEPFDIFTEKHFDIQVELLKDEKGEILPMREQWLLTGSRLYDLMQTDESFDMKKRAAYLKYLRVKHKVERKQVKYDNTRLAKAYFRIKEKDAKSKAAHDSVSTTHVEKF